MKRGHEVWNQHWQTADMTTQRNTEALWGISTELHVNRYERWENLSESNYAPTLEKKFKTESRNNIPKQNPNRNRKRLNKEIKQYYPIPWFR